MLPPFTVKVELLVNEVDEESETVIEPPPFTTAVALLLAVKVELSETDILPPPTTVKLLPTSPFHLLVQ